MGGWSQWQSTNRSKDVTTVSTSVGMFVGNKKVSPKISNTVVKSAYLGNKPVIFNTYSTTKENITFYSIIKHYNCLDTDDKSKACITNVNNAQFNSQFYNFSYASTIPLIICNSVKMGYFYATNNEELYAEGTNSTYFTWDVGSRRLQFDTSYIKPTNGNITHSITMVSSYTSPTTYYKNESTGISSNVKIKRRSNNEVIFDFTMLNPNYKKSDITDENDTISSANIYIFNNFITSCQWGVANSLGNYYNAFNFIQTNNSWNYLNNPYVRNAYFSEIGSATIATSISKSNINVNLSIYAYNSKSTPTQNDILSKGTCVASIYHSNLYVGTHYGIFTFNSSTTWNSNNYIFDSENGSATYLLVYGNIT